MPTKKELLTSGLKSAAISAIALFATEGAKIATSLDYTVVLNGHPVDLTPMVVAVLAVVVSLARKVAGM